MTKCDEPQPQFSKVKNGVSCSSSQQQSSRFLHQNVRKRKCKANVSVVKKGDGRRERKCQQNVANVSVSKKGIASA